MSENKKFDVPEVLAALEAAVAKRGAGYVYVNEDGERAGGTGRIGCQYTHHADTDHASPGCIVGQVYYDLTGSLVPGGPVSSEGIESPRSPRGVFTDAAVGVLAEAQYHQDQGYTWGEALTEAKKLAVEADA